MNVDKNIDMNKDINDEYYWDYEKNTIVPISKLYIETNFTVNNKLYQEIKNDIELEQDYWYLDNKDIGFWESLLGRELDSDDKKIFHGIWIEQELNLDIKSLQHNLIKSHCYIKAITNNVGNCLFESLASLGLGDNDLDIIQHIMLRKNIASILLSMRNEQKFFPNIELTPEEIFDNSNDIEGVKERKTKLFYIYNYDTMIVDLVSNCSWERLPTEFILMTISRIYQVKILIYHNKYDYINKINVWEGIIPDDQIEIIRLGQINEEHYFPILELPTELKNQSDVINEILQTNISYSEYSDKFKKWAKLMIESISSINLNNNISDLNPNQLNNNLDNIDNNTKHQMNTNINLSPEQIEDYNQISNIDFFDVL